MGGARVGRWHEGGGGSRELDSGVGLMCGWTLDGACVLTEQRAFCKGWRGRLACGCMGGWDRRVCLSELGKRRTVGDIDALERMGGLRRPKNHGWKKEAAGSIKNNESDICLCLLYL